MTDPASAAASVHLPFTQVDAFADAPFTGNPAAVIALDAWLPDAVLQAIAAENNLAETAFTVPLAADAGADFALRWFTPTVEVALCGHATLAAGHVLIGERDRVRFRTGQAGDLIVAKAGDGAGDRDGGGGGSLALTLPDWPALPAPLPAMLSDMARAIGGMPADMLWREGGYAVLVYAHAGEIAALSPDFAALRPHGNIVLICTAPGEEEDVVSRVFVPGGGIDEDAVTGSAHCVIAGYWTQRLGRATFTARQASARGGRLTVQRDADGVTLTGRCRTVITGVFHP